MKKMILGLASLALVLGAASIASAVANVVMPSTNDDNRTNGWAHVDQLSVGLGTTNLEFISTRPFYSCFEYRTDGDISQKIGEVNYNKGVTDGLYPFVCVNNSSSTLTIVADNYVEFRMVFGAETDERFDWTRYNVIVPSYPHWKEECKNGEWKNFNPGFKNQGECISYAESNEKAGKETRR